jgi:hypothetical protein
VRLVRLERQQSRVADDVRAALVSLGRGSTVIGGIALVGVGSAAGRPIEAVVVLPHGVIIVVGVDLPDPALRLEAPLSAEWKADGWPLVADGDAVNPATDALDVSQACERRIAELVPGTAPVGTIIAVGPYVETVDQPARDLAGPVRVLHPTPTTMLAATVSLATAHRPRSVDQARALIRGLAPEAPEFSDEVLLGEGFSRYSDDTPPESLGDAPPTTTDTGPAPPAPAGAFADACPRDGGSSRSPQAPTAPDTTTGAPADPTPAAPAPPDATGKPATATSAPRNTTTATGEPADSATATPAPPDATAATGEPALATPAPRNTTTVTGEPADPTRGATPITASTGTSAPGEAGTGAVTAPASEAGGVPSQEMPALPTPTRASGSVRWVPLGAIGLLVALVVAAIAVATTGDDTAAAPPAAAAAPASTSRTAPRPAESLRFDLRAADGDQRCASHAFGDAQASLQQTSCSGVRRASYAATVDGRAAAVTIGIVAFPDAGQAATFKAVADTPGAGGVLDLATETGEWGATPPRFENAVYASELDGASVRLVQAVWVPGPSTADDPGLTRAAKAALDLPAK